MVSPRANARGWTSTGRPTARAATWRAAGNGRRERAPCGGTNGQERRRIDHLVSDGHHHTARARNVRVPIRRGNPGRGVPPCTDLARVGALIQLTDDATRDVFLKV